MYSVLFVCTGNQFRSPIAAETFREQLARDGLVGQWTVGSAGTWTTSGRQVLPEAVRLARSCGISIDGHKTRMISAEILEEADLIMVMEQGHKESLQVEFPFARKKVHLLSQVLDGLVYDIPDPASAREEAKSIIFDLVASMRSGYKNICQIAEKI